MFRRCRLESEKARKAAAMNSTSDVEPRMTKPPIVCVCVCVLSVIYIPLHAA